MRALDGGATPGLHPGRPARAVEVPVPLVAMTYYNLVFRAGHARFARNLVEAGIRGRHRAGPARSTSPGRGKTTPEPPAWRRSCWLRP